MAQALSPEQVLTRELRTWRERRELTAQQLADRIADSGGRLSRQAISKIENGDRKVTLDELTAIGQALGVPPLLLFLPLGKEAEVQFAPSQALPTWDAVKWWMGAAAEADYAPDASALFGFFRDHDELVRTVEYNRDATTGLADTWAERLRDLRKNMRRAGVLPPVLPASLSDLDT